MDLRNTGVIKKPAEVQKIFNMNPDVATVPVGHASKIMVPLLVEPLASRNFEADHMDVR